MNIMKKAFVVVFAVGLSLQLKAQNVRFGIKIEPQSTWFIAVGDNSGESGKGIGINFGLMADKYFTDNYAISTGISLNSINGSLQYNTATNWQLNGTSKPVSALNDIDLSIQYVEIPLGLKFLSKAIGYFKIYADLGADGMVRIKALADVPAADYNNNTAKEEISLLNFGYYIGGGIEYSLGGNTSLVAGLKYTSGLVDITAEKTDDVNFGSIALRLGIMF